MSLLGRVSLKRSLRGSVGALQGWHAKGRAPVLVRALSDAPGAGGGAGDAGAGAAAAQEGAARRFLRVGEVDLHDIEREIRKVHAAPSVVVDAVPADVLAREEETAGISLPELTIPADAVRFQAQGTIGKAALDEHFDRTVPRFNHEYKVKMFVHVPKLGLSAREEDVLQQLVLNRYDHRKRELKLTCDRFLSRVENRTYLLYLLQNIVLEVRKLAQDSILPADASLPSLPGRTKGKRIYL